VTALAFVDCETTGVHPGRLPWEIAIIRREEDGTERNLLLQIEDVDLSDADPFGLKIGGFYQRFWRYGDWKDAKVKAELDAAHRVEEWTRGAHLVGAVPNFDAETFAAMLRRHKLAPAWHYHLIDVEALAVGYLCGQLQDVKNSDMGRAEQSAFELPWRSDDLSRACGVTPPSEQERHTAMGDALWAKRWYDAIVSRDD
jgi:hypothetical protein